MADEFEQYKANGNDEFAQYKAAKSQGSAQPEKSFIESMFTADYKKQDKKSVEDLQSVLGKSANPLNTLRSLVYGFGKAGANIADTFTGGHAPPMPKLGLTDETENPLATGLGQAAPFVAAGGESIIGQLLAGGAYGGTQTQRGEENLGGLLPSGKVGGAIEGALLNAVLMAAPSLVGKLSKVMGKEKPNLKLLKQEAEGKLAEHESAIKLRLSWISLTKCLAILMCHLKNWLKLNRISMLHTMIT